MAASLCNCVHPFDNPDDWTNFYTCVNILIFPFGLVVMFGRMLNNLRHAAVLYAAMMVMFLAMVGWAVVWDTMQPNPALMVRAPIADAAGKPYVIEVQNAEGRSTPTTIDVPARGPSSRSGSGKSGRKRITVRHVGGSHVFGRHHGGDLRLGQLHARQLNPLAGLTPMAGMWLNCVFGGNGVGLINLLIYLIVGVFLAGLMVGRTPEYLGKKVEAREMKLAMLALLIHPILILGPTGLFAALRLGAEGDEQSRARTGFREILYEFSSASANNGSGFEGLGDTWGFNDDARTLPPDSLCRLGHRHRPGHALRPLHSDHRSDCPGRQPGGQEADAVHGGHAAHRHGDLRVRAAGHDLARGRCCFCRPPCWDPWPNTSDRCRLAVDGLIRQLSDRFVDCNSIRIAITCRIRCDSMQPPTPRD